FLVSGSVSWRYFSDRLMELPLGTFGIAIAIVVLPNLSRKHAEQSMDEFSNTLDWAFRLICLIAIPATVALVLIAEPLLVTLFQNENFTETDVIQASGSLRAYAVGLLAFMAIKIFAPGYYARQNTVTPVRIGIIAMTTNMALNIIFYLNGLAHVGLALATSLAAVLNAVLLLAGLRSDGVFRFQNGWFLFLVRIIAANGVMAYFLVSVAGNWQQWPDLDTITQLTRLVFLVIGGMALYSGMLFASGLRWKHIYR
ncbi:MAG: polysaccharide biosynthesis C-terminal domain-containing protein, partial [Pseudomonadales bacterium]|nr:polysaccharide biosynthesis C-terminal domain-containing protein [Pseudomonadales bacterium]